MKIAPPLWFKQAKASIKKSSRSSILIVIFMTTIFTGLILRAVHLGNSPASEWIIRNGHLDPPANTLLEAVIIWSGVALGIIALISTFTDCIRSKRLC